MMQSARGFDGYLLVLPALLDVAEAAASRSGMDPAEMNRLASYLAEIKFLLGEIDRYAGHRIDTFEALRIAERYRELEGKVKELRNDRMAARPQRGIVRE